MTPDEVRMLDNRYAILFIRGEHPVIDLKYDILKHPNVKFTTDGKGKTYEHGQDNTSIAVAELSLDEELLEKAIQISDEDGADIAFLTEEELEEHIEKNGGTINFEKL